MMRDESRETFFEMRKKLKVSAIKFVLRRTYFFTDLFSIAIIHRLKLLSNVV